MIQLFSPTKQNQTIINKPNQKSTFNMESVRAKVCEICSGLGYDHYDRNCDFCEGTGSVELTAEEIELEAEEKKEPKDL